jgi:beta-lactamase superfamily II metal-dependent hydrolase
MKKPANAMRLVLMATNVFVLSACVTTPSEVDTQRDPGLTAVTLTSVARPMDVWLLDVGQGSCVFVRCPDKKRALIVDCGTTSIGATSGTAITAWINEQLGDEAKATVLVSHGDVDHYSLLSAHDGIDPDKVEKAWVGGNLSDYNAAFRAWISSIPGGYGRFSAGEHVKKDGRFACGAATIDLLAVNTSAINTAGTPGSRKNADSAVVRLSYHNESIILPGDAEGITENAAISNANSLGVVIAQTSLLVGSHHGAATHGSNGSAWVSAIRPRAAAFSGKVDYKHRHPRCGPLNELSQTTTDINGSVEISCGNGRKIEAYSMSKRVMSSFENGHVLVRVSATGVKYLCERMSAACDGELEPDEIP